uniref:Uncharacterized protein n=1 Tax=Oncorhynchus mykiss TaxID=8022 RepID=A0A8C7M1E0_ONCMY
MIDKALYGFPPHFQLKIGILVVVVGAAADDPIPADNVDVALVIEEQVIIHELHNVPNAFATLIGLLYCPNMDYPNCLRYTFEVVQKMFLKIGAENCTFICLVIHNAINVLKYTKGLCCYYKLDGIS